MGGGSFAASSATTAIEGVAIGVGAALLIGVVVLWLLVRRCCGPGGARRSSLPSSLQPQPPQPMTQAASLAGWTLDNDIGAARRKATEAASEGVDPLLDTLSPPNSPATSQLTSSFSSAAGSAVSGASANSQAVQKRLLQQPSRDRLSQPQVQQRQQQQQQQLPQRRSSRLRDAN
ncbi:hypothetical protein HK405_001054, partial [Cladochytrium tenue]